MVCSNKHVSALNRTCNNINDAHNFGNRIPACIEHLIFGRQFITDGVNGIMVDINDLHTTGQFLPFRIAHPQQICVLHSNALRIRCKQDLFAVCGANRRHTINKGIHILVHSNLRSRQQCCHTELCDRGEHCLHGLQLGITLGIACKSLTKFSCNFIAQCIGNNYETAALLIGKRSDIARIEIPLPVNLRSIAQLSQIAFDRVYPAIVDRLEIPALIEILYIANGFLQLIIQNIMGILECIGISEMEMSVECIHFIASFRVELPHCCGLHNMESTGMVLIELLHFCNIVQTVIVVLKLLVPARSSTVLRSFQNQIGLNNLLANLTEEFLQNAFVNSREQITHQKSFNLLLVKATGQLNFPFHGATQIQKIFIVLTASPFVDNAVAVSLVGLGNKPLQAFEHTGTHSLRLGSQ